MLLIEPLPSSETTPSSATARKWLIKVMDLANNGAEKNETFDAVMICNGHYFEPSMPILKGHDLFKGQQLHSHAYRVPDVFSGKTAVVLGAGPSGTTTFCIPLSALFFLFYFLSFLQEWTWLWKYRRKRIELFLVIIIGIPFTQSSLLTFFK